MKTKTVNKIHTTVLISDFQYLCLFIKQKEKKNIYSNEITAQYM